MQSFFLLGLLSKSMIRSLNVLISGVDVHFSHISQPTEFHCHIISISEVIANFWYSFGTKSSSSILKGFRCSDEAQKCNRWALARIFTCRLGVAIFKMGL